jgi:hypothetical protein
MERPDAQRSEMSDYGHHANPIPARQLTRTARAGTSVGADLLIAARSAYEFLARSGRGGVRGALVSQSTPS